MLYWCFSFWLTSFCIIGSTFIHLIRTDSNAFSFYNWVIFHCVYVPWLSYPFICWWPSRLLPCHGYCKQYSVNTGVHVSLSVLLSSVCMPSSGIAGSYGSCVSSFLRNLHTVLCSGIPTNSVGGELESLASPTLAGGFFTTASPWKHDLFNNYLLDK